MIEQEIVEIVRKCFEWIVCLILRPVKIQRNSVLLVVNLFTKHFGKLVKLYLFIRGSCLFFLIQTLFIIKIICVKDIVFFNIDTIMVKLI